MDVRELKVEEINVVAGGTSNDMIPNRPPIVLIPKPRLPIPDLRVPVITIPSRG